MAGSSKNLLSPIEIFKKIDAQQYVLPRFQRELDWKTDKISKLFDSIYKGFNINLVVLWKPKVNKQYYKFIQNYIYKMHNEESENGLSLNKTFVLDGQQRFEAIYIGLSGTYKEKNGVEKKLYFYLGDPGKSDAFCFISQNEYEDRLIKDMFYIKVSDFTKYTNTEKLINGLKKNINESVLKTESLLQESKKGKQADKLSDLIQAYNNCIKAIDKEKKKIIKLYNKLNEDSIMYYMVDNSLEDENVEELFVRMNTGGSQLSNSEIILSKLSTKWELNARNEINKLIDDINHWHDDGKKYKYDFSINLDLIMKSYLVLLDKQSVSFSLNAILNNDKLIKEMETKFNDISQALKNAFAFIKEYGFTRDVLKSNNAIIPIAYILYKNKLYSANPKHFVSDIKYNKLQKSIIKWLCCSLLSNFWSGANDTSLVTIRKCINEYKGDINNFDMYHHLKKNNSLAQRMNVDISTIDNTILNYSYNSSYKYSVLCVLYLNNNKNSNYMKEHHDVDHIFPKSKFNDKFFDKYNLDKDARNFYKENYNLLPNLQLLTQKENRSNKKDKLFDEWIHEFYSDKEIKNVLESNFIDKVYTFDQFKIMFEKRRKKLKEELLKIFE